MHMKPEIVKHLTNIDTWVRGFFMLAYTIIYYLAQCAILGVVMFQFGSQLLTGNPNKRLVSFGQNLSIYISQILDYLCYSSETKPFPLTNWPQETRDEESQAILRETEVPQKNEYNELRQFQDHKKF